MWEGRVASGTTAIIKDCRLPLYLWAEAANFSLFFESSHIFPLPLSRLMTTNGLNFPICACLGLLLSWIFLKQNGTKELTLNIRWLQCNAEGLSFLGAAVESD